MTGTWTPVTKAGATTGPLSSGQRSLWFLDSFAPGTATYNIPWALRLRGPLDVGLLQRCLDTVVQRHEALRTTFSGASGEPRQVVHPAVPVPIREYDVSAEPDPAAAAAARLESVTQQGFDLDRGPLLRAALVREQPGEATLLVVFHHIVFDELSTTVFERELSTFYTAAATGVLPRPPVAQYLDYAGRQRDLVAAPEAKAGLDRWRDRLDGAPTVLELPADRPRPTMRTFAGATSSADVPAPVAARVRALAIAEGTTTYVVLLAAFAALLRHDTGQEDLVIGSPVAGRDRFEWEDLIGYFVNMLPLRVDAGGDPAFQDLVRRVNHAVLDDLDHQDVPFESIVDAVLADRPADHSPLAQVVFGMHDERTAHEEIVLGPVRGTRLSLDTATAKFDLIWSVSDRGTGLGVDVEYDTALFDEATIGRTVQRWLLLLDAVTRDPRAPIGAADLLTAADRAIVDPVAPAPARATVPLHTRFERVAARYPERTAVSANGDSLTYAQLDAGANRVAHRLRALGVEPGERVGLRLEPSTAQVEAVLGVLKAGAAYVPVNTVDPAERADLVFADAGVRLVLSDEDLRAAAAAEPAGDPGVPVSAHDPAYVIYTSGSTGRPKGVEVTHHNVASLFDATSPEFRLGADDVWTVFHSYAFDFSVWELWGALLHGARAVLVPFAVSRTPGEFARLLADERVTVLSQTPSALGQLTAALAERPRALPDLRLVVLGGEALRPHHVAGWFRHADAPDARLCNMYGITETTVHVTRHDIGSPADFPAGVIGRPLPHLSVAVLTPAGKPAPIGITGEMVVGGAGVANGYVRNPGLTARRFVSSPVAGDDSTWYRSGDLARWRADGTLEYRGRSDHQVKIRGFRIEPGEIEHVLAQHPAVTGCAVLPRTEPGGPNQYLVAYAAVGGTHTTAAELRAHLVSRLPAHLVPAVITPLDTLPLTANGKVDHAALPAAARTPDEPDRHEPPRTERERLLARVWQDVLGVEQVGRTDNFFELGGDSIRSVDVAGRMRNHGYDLSLTALFASPVLADLAAAAAPAGAAGDAVPSAAFDLVPAGDRALLPAGVVDAYPMTSMQLAMVYHMELEPDRSPYQNVNSYRMSGAFDEDAMSAALAEVTTRHPVLRTSFDLVSSSVPMQLVHESATVDLTVEDLRDLDASAQHARVVELADREWSKPFDMTSAPMLRVFIQRLATGTYQFTLVEHHAILDGWSFTSLLAELLRRHAELRDNPGPRPAPAPVTSFRDYVALERAAAESAGSQRFWAERLSGVRPTTLPRTGSTDARPADSGVLEREIPEALGARLRRFAAEHGVGVKSAALAAHVVALAKLTGDREIVTGLTVNGRPEDDTGTDAKGVFLNTVPIRATPGPDWPTLVRDLHRQETELLPHRRTPHGEIIRHLAGPALECSFTFNRFHALGTLSTTDVSIIDPRLGVEPTVRREPNHFPLNVALVQDPGSDRSLLIADSGTQALSPGQLRRYAADYAAAVDAMTGTPWSPPLT
ncbi:amino acid adenylation domain-containing protein [Amycolatopsis sp. WQ 127309]|uniref:amino acid adenylation domain-containing protein n=1 Tax=Amycolatopsis sp. WQ 127309 TaxID=2932773 RepID=UPI001FF4377A|nr:amino acid adenylation domain-containing protein [Amycolatopsis sp. WQ 127309]UOZ05563.1 amino acid adenylation domain-containing protein [Amycolatopsis sp. WQ 127309]